MNIFQSILLVFKNKKINSVFDIYVFIYIIRIGRVSASRSIIRECHLDMS